MAKSFNKLKDGLGLLDFLPIGKYKQCRVDSIIEQDYEYLIYMDKEKILRFAPEVIDKLKNRFRANIFEVKVYHDSYDQINGYIDNDEYYSDEDVPF